MRRGRPNLGLARLGIGNQVMSYQHPFPAVPRRDFYALMYRIFVKKETFEPGQESKINAPKDAAIEEASTRYK